MLCDTVCIEKRFLLVFPSSYVPDCSPKDAFFFSFLFSECAHKDVMSLSLWRWVWLAHLEPALVKKMYFPSWLKDRWKQHCLHGRAQVPLSSLRGTCLSRRRWWALRVVCQGDGLSGLINIASPVHSPGLGRTTATERGEDSPQNLRTLWLEIMQAILGQSLNS